MATSAYLQTNAKYPNPFLFSLTSRGFYSEINCLLNAVLFGIITKRRLHVDQSRFAGGALMWSDVYRSHLPLTTENSRAQTDSAWIITSCESNGFVAIRDRVTRWHRHRRFFLSRSYGFYRNVFAAKRYLARQLCQPVAPTQWPDELKMPFAAIHVRRGDKTNGYTVGNNIVIEGDRVPLGNYVSMLRKKAPHVKSLFVMTDDYRVVDDLRSMDSSLAIFTLCQKDEHGYDQGIFDSQAARSKIIGIRRLIAEVEIASQSHIFVGCYKSNVSRYIALTHKHPSRCYSADELKEWTPA